MKWKVPMKTSGREVRGTCLGESFVSSGPEADSCQGLCPQIPGCWSYISFSYSYLSCLATAGNTTCFF